MLQREINAREQAMAFEVTYVVDEETQTRSWRQVFRRTMGRSLATIVIVAVAAAIMTCFLPRWYLTGIILGALATLSILAAAMWAQTARAYDRIARSFLTLDDDRNVTLAMDDEAFEARHALYRRRLPWGKVTRAVETEDAVILYHDRLVLALLPKRYLGGEGIEIIRQHTPAGNARRG